MPWVASDPIRVVVPGPPKALGRQRHRLVEKRDGSRFVANYMPTKSAREQSSIRAFAAIVMGNMPLLDGPLDLRMVAYMPIAPSWSKKKRAMALSGQLFPTGTPDADNILKLLADAFTDVIWKSDALVTDCHVWKRYSDRPRLSVEVRSLTWRD
jgi:Holliday junction resolvase RusA-like endonuclease